MMAHPSALLFPGQGSEEPRMGLAFAEVDEEAAALLKEAGRLVGADLFRLLQRGGRALARTELIQPALAAIGLGAARAVERCLARAGVRPRWVLGHSLGELVAACHAARLRPEAALALAAERGELMGRAAAAQASGASGPGGMAALRAEPEEVEALLAESPELGLSFAGHNAPGEVVVAGPERCLSALARRAPFAVQPLRVAGAWHSEAMRPAVAPLRARLREAFAEAPAEARARAEEEAPLYVASGALPFEAWPDHLAEALVRPTHLVAALCALEAAGARALWAVAPSRLVRSLARRSVGARLELLGVDLPADLEPIAQTVRGSSEAR